jgi:hypothetical protein
MAFVVDGSEWTFDGWNAQQVQDVIDQFTATLRRARSRDESVWLGEDLQYKPVMGELDIWRLWEAGLGIQFEVWQGLAAELGRLTRYLDEQPWPDGFGDDFSVSISGAPAVENVDVSWAHHHVRSGRALGCIGLLSTGPKDTRSAQGNAQLHWISDDRSQRLFWRSAVDIEGAAPATFRRIAPHAYPSLYFCPGVLEGAEDLRGGYYANLPFVQRYLEVFDDRGAWAFTTPPPALSPDENPGTATGKPSNQIIERRFMGLGVTVAPENPNVYEHANCRSAREVSVGGAVLYCEWHGKLQEHQNRIHVHAPVPQSGNLLVIGKIATHLPLPGD